MQTETASRVAIPYRIASTSDELGRIAAQDVAGHLRTLLAGQQSVRMIFAAAPSQSAMLAALIQQPDIDWTRVTAFHMDEYLDLPEDSPQRFAAWLDRHLFDHLSFAAVHRIKPTADPTEAVHRYAELLAEASIDLVCCGIGANGHLAFNDPPADFADPESVRIVALDQACRQQQVDDKCFASFAQVPTHAITLTVPRLLAANRIFCCVPGFSKAAAVAAALLGPLTPQCPASALRTHPNCMVYLDRASSAGLGVEHSGSAAS